MPVEMASRFAKVEASLAEALAILESVKANGADLEADVTEFRTTLNNPVLRASSTLFFIGDRYAILSDPARLLRGHYHEESLWTEPPMWYPGAPIYGYEDELIRPGPSPGAWIKRFKWADAIPLESRKAILQLAKVLEGLDRMPQAKRIGVVNACGLLTEVTPYMARTGGWKTPDSASYQFASLLEPGPLSENEGHFVTGLLRTYCNVAHTRRRANEEHPYIALRRQHDSGKVSHCAHLASYWEDQRRELENEWRIYQRNQRVERKRAILKSGLAFQVELADLIAPAGYACQNFQRKDRGIDLVSQRNGGPKIGIQVKKHQKPIGAAAVRELRGAREVGKYDVVVLVSASGFTKDARKESRIQPRVPLVSLEELLERMDLGQDPLFPPARAR